MDHDNELTRIQQHRRKSEVNSAAKTRAGQVDGVGTGILNFNELEILVLIRAVGGRWRGVIVDFGYAQGRNSGDIEGLSRRAPGVGAKGPGEDDGGVGQRDRAAVKRGRIDFT